MWNFKKNKTAPFAIPVLLIAFLVHTKTFSQEAIDFGVGPTISTGLQNEWALHLKSQYHFNEKWNAYAGYNLFFRRDVTSQNTETYNAFELGGSYQILNFSSIEIYSGLGYIVNNFPIDKNDPDTSKLFLNTGKLNHAAQVKFLGTLPLSDHLLLFSEYNFTSFGKRYETLVFGLIYRLSD